MRFFAIVLLVAAVCRVTAADAPEPAADLEAAADFTKLRMDFAARPDYQGSWVSDKEREAVLALFGENKPAEFIKAADLWLEKCPVDAKVHLMRAKVALEAGDVQGHFLHRMIYYGLMSSIVLSGDGKTPKTAYKVISVDEEYALLNHIGAKLIKQSLVEGPCDKMEVKLGEAETAIFFNVGIPLAAEQRLLDSKKKE